MLTVKKQHAKPPAGGHRFVAGPMRLKGETVDEVLDKMEKVRAANSLPLEFPEEDLAVYYQQIAPYLVKEIPGRRAKSRAQIEAEAIMAFWKLHPSMIDPTIAIIDLRRRRCVECPLRSEFHRGGDADRPYVVVARRRAALLCNDREFAKNGRCSWCELPVDLICRVKKPQELPGLPPVPKVCWVNEL